MPKFIAFIFFVSIQWILFLANTGYNCQMFESVRSLPYGDKLTHFVMFGTLTLILNYALKFEIFSIIRIKIYIGTITVAIFAFFEEFSQLFFPARTFDLNDMAAGSIGIVFFTLLTYFTEKLRLTENLQ